MEALIKFLMIIHVLSARTLAEKCPFFADTDWTVHNYAVDCKNGTTYHCREYREQPIHFCHSILVCTPGSFAALVEVKPSPKLQCVPCPDDRFDPEESRSDIKSECQFVRQKCQISEHKKLWKKGNPTADDMCYCDYKAGYDMDADWFDVVPTTSIKLCDGITRCDCRRTLWCNPLPEKLMCLLPNKTCAEPCPSGYTRPDFNFDCVAKNESISTRLNDTTAVPTPPPELTSTGNVQTTSKSVEETPRSTNENSNSHTLLILVVIVVCLTVILIPVAVLFIKSKCPTGSRKGKENVDTPFLGDQSQVELAQMLKAVPNDENNVDEDAFNLSIR